MTYEVQLFAALKDGVGKNLWRLDADTTLTGTQLIASFFEANPGLVGLRHTTRLAVNQQFVQDDPILAESDELALIPPVSGG